MFLLAGVGAVATSSVAAATPAAPYRTISNYEYGTNASTLSAQGSSQAGASSYPGRESVILAFGRPAFNGTSYGVVDYGSHFDTFNSVYIAAQNYAMGYWSGTYGKTKTVLIMLGTSNNLLACTSCSYSLPASRASAWGTGWGHMVNNLQTWMDQAPALTTEYADGAIDAEPHYDPGFTNTSNIVKGFNSGSHQLLDDFGSTDGTGAPGNWWSWAELYDISWGSGVSGYADDVNQGQMYNLSAISEWAQLYQWSEQNHGSYSINGILVQCTTSCPSTNLPYTTAYTDLENDLYSDFHYYPTISWTTAI